MSKVRFAVAFAVSVLAATVQLIHLPSSVGGANLRALAGQAPDPNGISWVVDRAVSSACSLNANCFHKLNFLALAVVLALFGALVAQRSKNVTLVALAMSAFALSPLTQSQILDPLGASYSLALGVFFIAAADIAGVVEIPLWGRVVVAAVLALVNPLMGLAALAYPMLIPRPSLRAISLPFFGAAAGLFFVAATGLFDLPAGRRIDSIAGPSTIVVLGTGLFIVAPVALFLWKRGAFAPLGLSRGRFLSALGLGTAALLGGLFQRNGDPSPYLSAFEGAILLGMLPGSGAASVTRTLQVVLAAIAATTVVAFVFFAGHGTSRIIAGQTRDLIAALGGHDARNCVASDKSGAEHLLADGAFLRLYPQPPGTAFVDDVRKCPTDAADRTNLLTINGSDIKSWGRALGLVRIFDRSADATLILPVSKGKVTPRSAARTPNHRGAFDNVVTTPLGPLGDFTVLSGYEYRFECLRIPHHATLQFAATSISGAPPLGFLVSSVSPGADLVVLRGSVPHVDTGPYNTWLYESAPIAASECATLSFKVTAEDGAIGQWMTFAGASIR